MQQEQGAAREWLVQGEVQGVGFRYFAQREAASLGLTGWAKNLPDGRVQVYACGLPERLDDLERALQKGPRAANVSNVASKHAEPTPFKGFEIR